MLDSPTHPETTDEAAGARFFDERQRDRGWANSVVRRNRALGRMVVLDVTSTDEALLRFLGALDRSPLRVELPTEGGRTYSFVWASGYDNGSTVRVQGVLR